MKSFRTSFFATVALLLLAVSYMVVQYRTIQRLTKQIAELELKLNQEGRLEEENAALSSELKTIRERTDAERRELLRLRGQVSALRDKDQEIAQLKKDRERMIESIQQTRDETANQSNEEAEKARTMARLSFSKQIGLSLIMFAADNQEQIPQDLGAASNYLARTPEMDAHNLHFEQFELLYKGRLGEAQDPGRTVLAREKQPMQRANGTWEQVYVFADGHSQVLSAASREQLAQRERELFILPVQP